MLRWILITLLATQAATCGQKGPLTLPEGQAFLPAGQLPTGQPFSVPAP